MVHDVSKVVKHHRAEIEKSKKNSNLNIRNDQEVRKSTSQRHLNILVGGKDMNRDLDREMKKSHRI